MWTKGLPESVIADRTARQLRAQGLDVRREVPYLSRSIDLVFLDEGLPVAVEFKYSHWRRALAQAMYCLTGATRAYICLPAGKVSEEVIVVAGQSGVGVLELGTSGGSAPWREVLRAPKSKVMWGVGTEWLLGAFRTTPWVEDS